MLRLKSCPRCKGDIVRDRDQWGWYEQCIQCGYLRDLQNVVEAKRRLTQETRAMSASKGISPLADGTVYSRRKNFCPFSTPPLEVYASILGEEKDYRE